MRGIRGMATSHGQLWQAACECVRWWLAAWHYHPIESGLQDLRRPLTLSSLSDGERVAFRPDEGIRASHQLGGGVESLPGGGGQGCSKVRPKCLKKFAVDRGNSARPRQVQGFPRRRTHSLTRRAARSPIHSCAQWCSRPRGSHSAKRICQRPNRAGARSWSAFAPAPSVGPTCTSSMASCLIQSR